jgi:HAMP domain-containing protein
MKLKTKLLLASSAIVLVVLGLSEWIGYYQMSQFLSGHEMRMASEMDHGTALTDLRQGRQALLVRLSTLHMFHGIFTIIALILALNALWSRTVLRPLADLLRHINYMGRGNWTTPVPVRSKDEIGELTQAFNELGGKLTLAVHQFASASKLAALSLLGQSLVKKAVLASDLLRASEARIECDHEQGEAASEAKRARVQLAIKTLEEIPVLFDAEFQRELSLHSAPPAPRPPDLPEVDAVSHPDIQLNRSCSARP